MKGLAVDACGARQPSRPPVPATALVPRRGVLHTCRTSRREHEGQRLLRRAAVKSHSWTLKDRESLFRQRTSVSSAANSSSAMMVSASASYSGSNSCRFAWYPESSLPGPPWCRASAWCYTARISSPQIHVEFLQKHPKTCQPLFAALKRHMRRLHAPNHSLPQRATSVQGRPGRRTEHQ